MSYIGYIWIAFKDSIHYRADVVTRVGMGFLRGFALISIWMTIVKSNSSTLDKESSMSILAYMVIISCLNILYANIPEGIITNKVRNGDISRELSYPVSFIATISFRMIGKLLASILFGVIPNFIFLSTIFNIRFDLSLVNILSGFSLLSMGIIIALLINLIIDQCSFWLLETFFLRYVRFAIFSFFSGSLVPLWLYPQWVSKIIDVLPFKFLYGVPVEIITGRYKLDEISYAFINSLFWVIVLYKISKIMWNRGVSKVEIMGG